MSTIGIGAAEYQIAGYQAGKTKSTVDVGRQILVSKDAAIATK